MGNNCCKGEKDFEQSKNQGGNSFQKTKAEEDLDFTETTQENSI